MLLLSDLPWGLIHCIPILISLGSTVVLGEQYDIVKEYGGKTFFDEWTFYDNYDNLTNGQVNFVSSKVASKSKLAFIDPSTNRAVISVDNTTSITGVTKRNSVRIQTNNRYSVGTVWTTDLYHVPYGCSVWPAWWSHAPSWPQGGEIDTFEGVNLAKNNQMGLHTLPGCNITGQKQSSSLVNSTNCSYQDNSNLGCITTDPDSKSYGEAFAQAGGGVFVTEFAESGISVWFFSRASIPGALSSNTSTIDTSTLGTPVGNWPSTNCASSQFFEPQNLIFDITLCGDFAGRVEVFSQTCPGVCQDYVLGNGSNYPSAYFDIATVRVFSKQGTNTVVHSSSTSPLFSYPSIILGLVGIVGVVSGLLELRL